MDYGPTGLRLGKSTDPVAPKQSHQVQTGKSWGFDLVVEDSILKSTSQRRIFSGFTGVLREAGRGFSQKAECGEAFLPVSVEDGRGTRERIPCGRDWIAVASSRWDTGEGDPDGRGRPGCVETAQVERLPGKLADGNAD
jgi:hypothetical protein